MSWALGDIAAMGCRQKAQRPKATESTEALHQDRAYVGLLSPQRDQTLWSSLAYREASPHDLVYHTAKPRAGGRRAVWALGALPSQDHSKQGLGPVGPSDGQGYTELT